MTDEQQARDLLRRATLLPDEIAPPVQHLIRLGRQRRRLRSAQRTLAVGVLAVVAVASPPVIHTISAGPAGRPDHPATHRTWLPPGPTATEIARFRWSSLPPSPLGARSQPSLIAAGRYVIELGGYSKGVSANDGAALDLKTGRWRMIAPVGANVGFLNATTTWTGSELFVVNAAVDSCLEGGPDAACLPHVGLYNPVANSWRFTPLPTALLGFPVAAAWTGRVVVLADIVGRGEHLAVGAYNPVTGRWQIITPHLPAGHPAEAAQLVATSDRVILWSQWLVNRPNPHRNDAGVDVLAFADDRASPVGPWRDVTGSWPQGRQVGPPIFTGNSIALPPSGQWCSLCGGTAYLYPGYFANSVTLRQTAAVSYGPAGETLARYLWTGRTIIAVARGRGVPRSFRLTDLADYDPGTRTWRSLAAVPRDERTHSLPVWTGSELVVVTDQGTTLALHR